MKRYLPTLALLVLLVIAPAASCPNAQRNTFNTISSLESTVDASYKAYLDLVIQGQAKTNAVPSISTKYEVFQASVRLAAATAELGSNSPPTAALTQAGTDLLTSINAAKGTP